MGATGTTLFPLSSLWLRVSHAGAESESACLWKSPIGRANLPGRFDLTHEQSPLQAANLRQIDRTSFGLQLRAVSFTDGRCLFGFER